MPGGRLPRADLDAPAQRVLVGEISPRQRLADHRHAWRILLIGARKRATFDDRDAHGSEVVRADLLRSEEAFFSRRRGPPFNLKLRRIPVVGSWEKSGGSGRLDTRRRREPLLRKAMESRDLTPFRIARRR